MWAISKLQLFEISSQEMFSIFLIWLELIIFCSLLFRNSITVKAKIRDHCEMIIFKWLCSMQKVMI